MPEQYLAEVKEYQARGPLAVEAQIPNDPRPPAVGQLTFIDNAVDTRHGHHQNARHVSESRQSPLAGAVR